MRTCMDLILSIKQKIRHQPKHLFSFSNFHMGTIYYIFQLYMFFFSRTFINYIHSSYLKCEYIIRKSYQKQLNQAEIATEFKVVFRMGLNLLGWPIFHIIYIQFVTRYVTVNFAITIIFSIKTGLSTSTKKKIIKPPNYNHFV